MQKKVLEEVKEVVEEAKGGEDGETP